MATTHSSPPRLGPCRPAGNPAPAGATARYRDLRVAGRSHSARRPFATLGIPYVVPPLLPVVLLLARRPWPRARPRVVHRARRGRRRRRPAHPPRGGRPQRRGQDHAAAPARRHRPARPRHRHPHAAVAAGGVPAPGARARRRDAARVPGTPHRRRRRGGRARTGGDRPGRRSRGRDRGRRRTAPRSRPTSRSAAPISTPVPARWRPTSDCPSTGWTRRPAPLSGGQAARASLAAILLSRFDVFLLDEPTNDLDFAGLERLETFLDDLPGGVVVVSHDRAFLERTVTRVLELDEHTAVGDRVRRGLGGVPRRPGHRPPPRRGGLRVVPGRAVPARATGADATRVGGAGCRRREARRRRRRTSSSGTSGWRSRRSRRRRPRATEKAIARLDTVEKPWEGWDLRFQVAERGAER